MKGLGFLFGEVKKERILLQNSLVMFIATGGSAIMTFAVNLILARIFGPESFANFKTVTYIVTFFYSLINFGIPVMLTKYVAEFRVKDKERISYLSRWSLKVNLMTNFTLLVLLVIFIKPITIYFLHDPSLSYLVLFSLSLALPSVINIFPSIVLGYENFNLYLISRMVSSIGLALFGVGLGYFFGMPYAIFGWAIANFLGNLICLRFLLKEKTFSKKDGVFDIKGIFWKFSVPMYIFGLPNSLGSAIVPLLSLFFTAELVGQYSFSFLFYYAGLVIPGTLASVLLPKISRLNSLKNDRKIKETLLKVFFAYTIIVVGGIGGALLFGETIISIIAPQYLPGITFFKVLVSFGLLTGYISIFNSYLTAKEKIKEVALMILLQNALLFLVSFLLMKGV